MGCATPKTTSATADDGALSCEAGLGAARSALCPAFVWHINIQRLVPRPSCVRSVVVVYELMKVVHTPAD